MTPEMTLASITQLIIGATDLAAAFLFMYGVKRMSGYAGIVNALFYADNCNMVYGDAAAVLATMIEAVRGLGAKAAA